MNEDDEATIAARTDGEDAGEMPVAEPTEAREPARREDARLLRAAAWRRRRGSRVPALRHRTVLVAAGCLPA